jgi:excinuclease ABC subunit B
VAEVRQRTEVGQRVLVTTLTKRMSEDLTEYLSDLGVRVHYLHSDVETLDRQELLRNLRLGEYDVLVGINLLREGLDLPEVSLVAILDADKEGFLRSETALVQTMGRAARHVDGKVIMYADRVTAAMKAAMGEVERRRKKQAAYNEEHGIVPQSIKKGVRDTIRATQEVQEAARRFMGEDIADKLQAEDLTEVISALESDMKQAAADLDFERAAELRDEIKELKTLLAS